MGNLTPDQYPAFVFVGLVAAVYVLAVFDLIQLITRRRSLGSGAGTTQLFRSLRLSNRILALIGIACFAYGYAVEPYWPEVSHVELRTPRFSRNTRAVRIVHISDVHSDASPRLENKLPAIIAVQKPDFILFSGDAANSDRGVSVFRSLMSNLARVAPTFGVKGNWNTNKRRPIELFQGTGATELNGAGTTIDIDGNKMWLAGMADGRAAEIPAMVSLAPEGAFKILLYHRPDEIYATANLIDLYCAGHTHGGQIALPIYGALLTLARYGKRFESGLYEVENTYLYVNRGIGMEGGMAPRVRFWARPEITVYEVRGQ